MDDPLGSVVPDREVFGLRESQLYCASFPLETIAVLVTIVK